MSVVIKMHGAVFSRMTRIVAPACSYQTNDASSVAINQMITFLVCNYYASVIYYNISFSTCGKDNMSVLSKSCFTHLHDIIPVSYWKHLEMKRYLISQLVDSLIVAFLCFVFWLNKII